MTLKEQMLLRIKQELVAKIEKFEEIQEGHVFTDTQDEKYRVVSVCVQDGEYYYGLVNIKTGYVSYVSRSEAKRGYYMITDYYVTLVDILNYVKRFHDNVGFNINGKFYVIDKTKRKDYTQWNLEFLYLHEQSEKLIRFLYNIIDKLYQQY